MIIIKKFFLVILILFIFCGCVTTDEFDDSSSITYSKITSEEAYKMMNGEVVVLDVRDFFEYNKGHIMDAVNIPVNNIESKISSVVDDKNKVIIVYCQSGGRAEVASSKLIELGYTNVYTFGGIDDWKYDLIGG